MYSKPEESLGNRKLPRTAQMSYFDKHFKIKMTKLGNKFALIHILYYFE